MPYIAFELDAMARAENVARSIGQPDTLIKGGLLNLWAHCFRETTDDVTPIQVRAFFGADVVDALVAFGFLEPTSDTYRVRGAGRYLRLKKAYSEGAAKTNALRRRPKASDSVRPSSPSGRKKTPVSDALAASSEQRAATTEQQQKAVAPTRALSDALVASYLAIRGEAYRFNKAADGAALPALLKLADIPTIIAKWERGLRLGQAFPGLSTIAELAGSKWNHLTATAPVKPTVFDRDKADGADVVDWAEEKRKTDAINERQRAWRELREQRHKET